MSEWPSYTPSDEVSEQRQGEFDAKRAELDAALHDTFLALLRAISSEAAAPTDGGERLAHLARAFATLQSGDYVMYSEGQPGLRDFAIQGRSGWSVNPPDDADDIDEDTDR